MAVVVLTLSKCVAFSAARLSSSCGWSPGTEQSGLFHGRWIIVTWCWEDAASLLVLCWVHTVLCWFWCGCCWCNQSVWKLGWEEWMCLKSKQWVLGSVTGLWLMALLFPDCSQRPRASFTPRWSPNSVYQSQSDGWLVHSSSLSSCSDSYVLMKACHLSISSETSHTSFALVLRSRIMYLLMDCNLLSAWPWTVFTAAASLPLFFLISLFSAT